LQQVERMSLTSVLKVPKRRPFRALSGLARRGSLFQLRVILVFDLLRA